MGSDQPLCFTPLRRQDGLLFREDIDTSDGDGWNNYFINHENMPMHHNKA